MENTLQALETYASGAPAPPHNLIEALSQHPEALGAIVEFGPEGVEILAKRMTRITGLGEHARFWTEHLAQVSPEKGAQILDGLEYTWQIRDTIRTPTGGRAIGKRQNVGFADFEINLPDGQQFSGSRENWIGVSGKKSPEGTVPPAAEDRRIFDVKDELLARENINRTAATDSENKILEAIAQQLTEEHEVQFGDANVTGKIILFTEREPCPPCDEIIKIQWKEKFPNIHVDVIHGPRFVRPRSDLQGRSLDVSRTS